MERERRITRDVPTNGRKREKGLCVGIRERKSEEENEENA